MNLDSKKYNNIKLFWSITKGILTFLLLLFFVISSLSEKLLLFLQHDVSGRYLVFLLFVLIAGAGLSIIFFPLNFYTDFYLEHKYNLSNQSFVKWIWEDVKGLLVGLLIGVPILLFFYYSLLSFNGLWWLPFAIGLFIISVILARIVPTFILPIFYKVTPIDNEELKNRIESLAKDAGIRVQNVFKFDMSKNTKKANAAFTGIGKSKRILLGDTLLENYSDDEIETVIAHELGHYKKKHIIKNIIIGTVSSFLTLFLIALFYKISLSWFGFKNIHDVDALPILSLWAMIIGLIQTPITNVISRKYEYEADEYAIESTRKTAAFIKTLEKLTDQNLGDKNPHPFVEWFFYSHPSIKKRILSIENVSRRLGLSENLEEAKI
jgi:STE24 endopeptidase